MTVDINDDNLLRIDESLAKQDIPFHARPLRAAMLILGSDFAIGSGDERIDQITAAYERLVPEARSTWPGMGTGLVASVDRVRTFTVGVALGSPCITIHQGLGFNSAAEWTTWCRGDRTTQARSAFAFSDMYDLVYGADTLPNRASQKYWNLASGQIKLFAEGLARSGSVSSAVLQPICLSVELATKGALLHLGVSEAELRRRFGHRLAALVQKVAEMSPHRDDSLMQAAAEGFPDYVQGRYEHTPLSRLQIVSLALDAQFIAATSVRRLSSYDLAAQIEATVGARPGSPWG